MDGVADRARKVMFVVSKTKQNLQVSKPDSFFLSRSASITVQTTLQEDKASCWVKRPKKTSWVVCTPLGWQPYIFVGLTVQEIRKTWCSMS